MKITAFIPSKNRSCQLQLLLSSFERNCPQLFSPYILYRATEPAYKEGYERLKQERVGRDALWIDETTEPIYKQFRDAIEFSDYMGRSFCIFTDDCVFYRPCHVAPTQVDKAFDNATLCFSFRLGFNTIVQDYSTGRLQPALRDYEKFPMGLTDAIRWRWDEYRDTDNYGYPFAMDGCTYLPQDLLEWTDGWKFDSFRTWEGASNGPPRRDRIKKRYMASFAESCVLNIPANSMQFPKLDSGRFYPADAKELNDKYLDGYVIDLDAFDFTNVQGCHQEHPFYFCKPC